MSPRPWHLGHSGANPYFAFTDHCNNQRPLAAHPLLRDRLGSIRPALAATPPDRDAMAAAIDQEIRGHRSADEARMRSYADAIGAFTQAYRSRPIDTADLASAHRQMLALASSHLPTVRPGA